MKVDLVKIMKEKAKEKQAKIVICEGWDERCLKASDEILKEGYAELVLLGNASEIKKKAIDFKELDRKSTAEIRQLQQQLIAEINKEVAEIMGKIGKKENYTLIVEKNMSGAAYYDKKIDLTSRVVKALNSK